jgi:hypothetical protein
MRFARLFLPLLILIASLSVAACENPFAPRDRCKYVVDTIGWVMTYGDTVGAITAGYCSTKVSFDGDSFTIHP